MVKNAAADPAKACNNKKQITPLFPDLTTYWARHTWATIAAALGHGGNDVTDIYIDFDEKKIDAANRKVINTLNKDKKQ